MRYDAQLSKYLRAPLLTALVEGRGTTRAAMPVRRRRDYRAVLEVTYNAKRCLFQIQFCIVPLQHGPAFGGRVEDSVGRFMQTIRYGVRTTVPRQWVPPTRACNPGQPSQPTDRQRPTVGQSPAGSHKAWVSIVLLSTITVVGPHFREPMDILYDVHYLSKIEIWAFGISSASIPVPVVPLLAV